MRLSLSRPPLAWPIRRGGVEEAERGWSRPPRDRRLQGEADSTSSPRAGPEQINFERNVPSRGWKSRSGGSAVSFGGRLLPLLSVLARGVACVTLTLGLGFDPPGLVTLALRLR